VSSSTLVAVIVLGIGCAANPWGIMIAILLLDARRGHGVVWTYVVAWTGAISVVLAALLAGLGTVFGSGSDDSRTAGAWILLAIGVVLVAFGLRRLLQRGQSDANAPEETPRWLRAIENISYPAAFVLGIYSATYPLVIAAAGEIASAETSDQIWLAVLFVVLGSSSVVGIAALGTFAPERSAAFLDRMRAWVTAHNRTVITAILLLLGVLLVARGLQGLL
jgi:Sap, sulfolipid-1-addressing protein